jgi:hypothetical protein
MDTRAAYACGSSPTILRVTNVNDSGANSFRAALTASGPRVVVFETSGNINLLSDIFINTPCLTVAGQTAPSPGITVRYQGIQIGTHDVLLQHFRIRPGWTNSGQSCSGGLDAIGTYPTASNIVMDHMSISWGQDENVYLYPGQGGGDANVTFWRSITSEGLRQAPGSAACTGQLEDGHGFLITQNVTKVAIIQSLFAHNWVRNPYGQNGSQVTILNNVIYDWYKDGAIDFESHSTLPGGPWSVTTAGNRFVRGPDTVDSGGNGWMYYYYQDSGETGNRIYRSDNTLTNDSDGKILAEENVLGYNPNVGSPPSAAPIPPGYTLLASTVMEAFVKANAGARPADRDAVDTRTIDSMMNRTGHIISTQNDVGGWPTLAVNARALTIPDSPHTVTSSGYTSLEVWLHGYAAIVEGGGPIAPAQPTGLHIVP